MSDFTRPPARGGSPLIFGRTSLGFHDEFNGALLTSWTSGGDRVLPSAGGPSDVQRSSKAPDLSTLSRQRLAAREAFCEHFDMSMQAKV